MGSRGKSWKEAASVILVARTSRTQNAPFIRQISSDIGLSAFDYRVLLLTRNYRGSFAGAHVFPGGSIDRADFSPSWMDLFKDAGISSFGALTSIKGPRPPMLVDQRHSPVPNDIAFRLCAIRETFEESGVLLVKKMSTFSSKLNPTSHKDNSHSFAPSHSASETVPFGHVLSDDLPDDLVKQWRRRVHGDASQFVALCRELECIPDLWALAEWSNWLTPTSQPRRFDTMFYICCLESIPMYVDHDKSEMIKSQWAHPEEVLQLYHKGTVKFAGPQSYELLRIARFPLLRDLKDFASRRAFLGCPRNYPKIYLLEDGVISVYEGDDLYPQGSKETILESLDTVQHLQETVTHSRNRCRNLNRMEMDKSTSNRGIQCNIEIPCGHVSPKPLEDLVKSAPKL